MLNVDRISVSQGGQQVLKGLSLTLTQGEIGAVMGKNGVGKTSLLYSLAGFLRLDAGAICLGDTVLSTADWTLAPEKRGIGMVFQDYALFPHLSARDNILFGTRAQPMARRDANLRAVIELTQLEDLIHKYPYELSGGEQQRVALARTLITEAELMMFDEPFANLDVDLKHRLSFGVRAFLKERNITALVASHNKVEALNICDRLGVIQAGRMASWRDKREISLDPSNTLFPPP